MDKSWGQRLCEGSAPGSQPAVLRGLIQSVVASLLAILGLHKLGVKRWLEKCLINTLESVFEATCSLYGRDYECLINTFYICKIFSSLEIPGRKTVLGKDIWSSVDPSRELDIISTLLILLLSFVFLPATSPPSQGEGKVSECMVEAASITPLS